ncbi:hypothetical protein AAHS21_26550 [Mycobacterium sp. 050272]|uniref:hypothetical protein n=1 Tax=Mycobacterium sp. 050272 TaxID=3142488 RepID=UPI0031992D15
MDAPERRTIEIGGFQVGAIQHSLIEDCPREIGAVQIRAAQIGAFHFSFRQIRSNEIRVVQTGEIETRAGQIRVIEYCSLQLRVVEVGVRQLKSAQMLPAQIKTPEWPRLIGVDGRVVAYESEIFQPQRPVLASIVEQGLALDGSHRHDGAGNERDDGGNDEFAEKPGQFAVLARPAGGRRIRDERRPRRCDAPGSWAAGHLGPAASRPAGFAVER